MIVLFYIQYSLDRRNFLFADLLSSVRCCTHAGAFGVVCAGVHLETGEVVAIKQIPRSMIQPTRLQAEVDLLRMAGQHKNVVNFRDLFSDENEYYIVMG